MISKENAMYCEIPVMVQGATDSRLLRQLAMKYKKCAQVLRPTRFAWKRACSPHQLAKLNDKTSGDLLPEPPTKCLALKSQAPDRAVSRVHAYNIIHVDMIFLSTSIVELVVHRVHHRQKTP